MFSVPIMCALAEMFKPRLVALLVACIAVMAAVAPQTARQWQAVAYSPDLPAGSRCTVPIELLRPTQFAVGYWEVDRRAENIAQKTPKKLAKYLQEHIGRIVIGPGGVPYLLDGHHLALALKKAKVANELEVHVVANWRQLTPEQFWAIMQQQNWVYLYDENGEGPQPIEKLPRRLTELRDDPYRALAWAVREQGGYRKTEAPFAEFRWAEFFRSRIKIGKQPGDFQRAINEAVRLSRTPAASDLPGFLGASEGNRPAPDSGAADWSRSAFPVAIAARCHSPGDVVQHVAQLAARCA